MTVYQFDLVGGDGTVTSTVYDTTAGTTTVLVDGEETEQRPITPDEVRFVEKQATDQAAIDNEAQMVTESDEAVDKLVAVVEALNAITDMTNQQINQNPAAIIKDIARELKTVARQANREARMTSGRTESTHTGTDTEV